MHLLVFGCTFDRKNFHLPLKDMREAICLSPTVPAIPMKGAVETQAFEIHAGKKSVIGSEGNQDLAHTKNAKRYCNFHISVIELGVVLMNFTENTKGVLKYMKLGIGTRCLYFITFYIPIRLYFSPYRSISLTCAAHVSPHHFIKAHVVLV